MSLKPLQGVNQDHPASCTGDQATSRTDKGLAASTAHTQDVPSGVKMEQAPCSSHQRLVAQHSTRPAYAQYRRMHTMRTLVAPP